MFFHHHPEYDHTILHAEPVGIPTVPQAMQLSLFNMLVYEAV